MRFGAWNCHTTGYGTPMKATFAAAVMLVCMVAGCGKKEQPPADAKSTNAAVGNPLTAPVDYVGAVGRAQRVSERVADTASLKRAIQMFHASEDRYPKDLNELLTSGHMPVLPRPPYGTKFQYNSANGEVKVVPAQ